MGKRNHRLNGCTANRSRDGDGSQFFEGFPLFL